ncbi:MAG: putative zinc-binding protein [Anaerolinea sp.]|nr:putative zinc-binding protein [Anaerolinea sp.]
MPNLPQKKVGIVACSGEELAEGTVTRLAALKVLEELRPDDTVTICLPLFLAGGEGDRAFARFYPTIAVDGCDLRCAARATEQYSGKPAAGVVVTEIVAACGIGPVAGRRRLNEAGQQAVAETAVTIADLVDTLLDKKWSRREGHFIEPEETQSKSAAACACGSGIPVQTVQVNGEKVTLIALPPLLEQFKQMGKRPSSETAAALLAQIKIYNDVPAALEPIYQEALAQEYALFCGAEAVLA